MKKLSIVCLAVVMAVVFGYGSAFADSAKATAEVTNLTEVSYSFPDEWYPIFKGAIHTANHSELIADVSLEVGITTDTTVWSKQLERSLANAMAKVEIMVVMDPSYVISDQDPLNPKEIWEVGSGQTALPGEVTFAMRDQTLVARLAGQLPLVCEGGTCYVKDGFEVSEIEEEMIRLMLNTLTANSFNFVLPDCSAGTHGIGVFAKFTYTEMDGTFPIDEIDPAETCGFSNAYLGKGVVSIEEVRMVKSDFEF